MDAPYTVKVKAEPKSVQFVVYNWHSKNEIMPFDDEELAWREAQRLNNGWLQVAQKMMNGI